MITAYFDFLNCLCIIYTAKKINHSELVLGFYLVNLIVYMCQNNCYTTIVFGECAEQSNRYDPGTLT